MARVWKISLKLVKLVFFLILFLQVCNRCLSVDLFRRNVLIPRILSLLANFTSVTSIRSQMFIIAMINHIKWEINLIIDLHSASFFAISFKVLWKTPRIFSGYTVHHIFYFVVSSLLSSLYHVLVDFDVINDSIILHDSRRLIWGESNFAIDDEVIIVLSFFNILQRYII